MSQTATVRELIEELVLSETVLDDPVYATCGEHRYVVTGVGAQPVPGQLRLGLVLSLRGVLGG